MENRLLDNKPKQPKIGENMASTPYPMPSGAETPGFEQWDKAIFEDTNNYALCLVNLTANGKVVTGILDIKKGYGFAMLKLPLVKAGRDVPIFNTSFHQIVDKNRKALNIGLFTSDAHLKACEGLNLTFSNEYGDVNKSVKCTSFGSNGDSKGISYYVELDLLQNTPLSTSAAVASQEAALSIQSVLSSHSPITLSPNSN